MGHMLGTLAFFASVAALVLLGRHWWKRYTERLAAVTREQEQWEVRDCDGRTSWDRLQQQLPEVFGDSV